MKEAKFLTQEEFLKEAKLFIDDKYGSSAAASREYGFKGSTYITESLKGNRSLPAKMLTDMGYTQTRTIVFTYEKVK